MRYCQKSGNVLVGESVVGNVVQTSGNNIEITYHCGDRVNAVGTVEAGCSSVVEAWCNEKNKVGFFRLILTSVFG